MAIAPHQHGPEAMPVPGTASALSATTTGAVGPLEVLLFTTDAALAARAIAGGVAGLVVDWEDRRNAGERAVCDQAGTPDTVDDLQTMAALEPGRIVCRINAVGAHTPHEIDEAVAQGATDVLAPMIESPHEVARLVDLVAGRAAVGIMIETVDACRLATEIARVPVDFVYVGLLDLAISRRERNLFRPLADGTADRVREAFADTRFGIGGVTVVDGGAPVACRVLLGELARLHTTFAFARRSFTRDMAGRDLAVELHRLQVEWDNLLARDPADVARDHADFAARFGGSWPR